MPRLDRRQLAPPDTFGGVASTRVVVQLDRAALPAIAGRVEKAGGAGGVADDDDVRPSLSRGLRRTLDLWKAGRVRPVYAEAFANPDLARKLDLDTYFIVEVPPGTDTGGLSDVLAAMGGEVVAADVDVIGGVTGDDPLIPNDPNLGLQYHLHNDEPDEFAARCMNLFDADIDGPEAWAVHTGYRAVCSADSPVLGTPCLRCQGGMSSGSECLFDLDCPDGKCEADSTVCSFCHGGPHEGLQCGTPEDCPGGSCKGTCDEVIIAILDSGVYSHVDFAGRMIPGRNVVPGQDPSNTTDNCLLGHGTHVTGIATATGNNGVGVAGVNWGASIMPVRVLPTCNGSIVETAAGIIWAADNGADVINMSLQFYDVSALNKALTENAVNYAIQKGVVLVAAAGNNRADHRVSELAQLVDTIAVSGVNECDELANGTNSNGFSSNYGPSVDISAHGTRIYSTFASASTPFGVLSGTSMAAPAVSGVAGLIKSFTPELTVCSIRNVLFASSEDLGDLGWDEKFGHGRLNAHQALLTAMDWPQVIATSPVSDLIDARIPHAAKDDTVRFGWSQVELTFRGDASQLDEDDFTVAEEGGIAGAPGVAGVFTTEEPDVLAISLDRPIDPRAWTSVTHDASCTGVRLGFLPGDVTGNGSVTEGDLETLLTELEFPSEPPLPESSTDINRSGALTPADLIDLIDLMNGAGLHDPYLGAALPR